MKTGNRKGVFRLVQLEFLALNLSLLTFFAIHFGSTHSAEKEMLALRYAFILLLFNLSWAFILFLNGHAETYHQNSFYQRLRFLVLNSFVLIGSVFVVCVYFQVPYSIQINLLFSILLFNLINIVFFRLWFKFHRRGGENQAAARALLVGGGRNEMQMPAFAQTVAYHGYEVVGMLNNNSGHQHWGGFAVNGQVQDLPGILETNPVDEIFINLSSLKSKELRYAIETADYYGVRVNLVPETPTFLSPHHRPVNLTGMPVFTLRQSPLDEFRKYAVKALFDYAFAAMVVLLLLPVFLLIGLLIYIEDKGPIFYRPVRKGEKGRAFECFKFRTMSVCDDPVHGERSTEKNDPRVTRVGKFLRKYDLDELPQFFNVLKGEMSVVGPRPHRIFLQNDFRRIVNEYMVRHYVKPGITGWAQVNGWRGPTKTIEQKKARVEHDLWYIEHWSLWLDVKIVFLTVFGRKTRQNAF